MKDFNFVERLALKLSEYFVSIPYVNCGGCGIVALSLYKELKKYEDNVKIVQINSRGHMFIHFIIELNGVYIDSNGIFAKNTKELNTNAKEKLFRECTFCNVDEKFLSDLWKKKNLWNSIFERGRFSKEIEKAVKEIVEQTVE